MDQIVAALGGIRQAQEECASLPQHTDLNQWLNISFPQTYYRISEYLTLTGENSDLIPYELVAETQDRENLELAVHSFGRKASFLIYHVRNSKDVSELYFLNRRTGGHANGLLVAFGIEAINEFAEHFLFYDGIAKRLRELGAENLIDDAYKFSRTHVTAHSSLAKNLLTWIQQIDEPARIIELINYFSDERNVHKFEACPTLVEMMILFQYRSVSIRSLDVVIPWDLAKRNELFMVEYLHFAQGFAFSALRYLSEVRDQYEDEVISKFLGTPNDKKFLFWSLLGAYLRDNSSTDNGPADFIERTASAVSEIEKRSKSNTHRILYSIHPRRWSDAGMLSILDEFGPAYAYIQEWNRANKSSCLSDATAQETIQRSRKSFRTNHYYRYIPVHGEQAEDETLVGTQMHLLMDNLRSRDPNFQKDRRLAIIALADYDHNSFIFDRAIGEIQDLKNNGYKVIFFEAGTHKYAFNSIFKWAMRHRDNDGETAKGIHYLRFVTHGESQRVLFGDPLYDKGKGIALDLESEAVKNLPNILHPDRPIVNFSGCLLGHGRNPFGKQFKSHVPNAKVIASKGCYDTGNLIFDSTGVVIGTDGRDSIIF